jgi:DNA-binding protein YbaB
MSMGPSRSEPADRLMSGAEKLDEMLARAGAMLAQRSDPDPSGAERCEGVGVSAGSRVRVVASGGRITDVVLDPRALAMPARDLAEAVKAAVNDALADLDGKLAQAVPSLGDPAGIVAEFAEFQLETVRQLAIFSDAVVDAAARSGTRE